MQYPNHQIHIVDWIFSSNYQILHKGCAGPWVLFWALKKTLKRANSLKKNTLDQKSAQKSALLSDQLKKVLKKEWVTQKSILDFLCNAQKSELYLSQLTNIGGDIIPWLVS